MRKVVKEIAGLSPLELAMLEKEHNSYNSYTAEKHDPWKTVYIVIENAHDFYSEMVHGYSEDYDEAEKKLNLYCSTYGGRIEQTTWGELENVSWHASTTKTSAL